MKTLMMKEASAVRLVLFLLVGCYLPRCTHGLDVRLRNVQCEDYPVKIAPDDAFKIVCPESGVDSTRCSFNGDTAYLSGNFVFDGVSTSNAYMTSNLQFVSLEYLLTKNQQVNFCDESWVQPNENYDANAAAAQADEGDAAQEEEEAGRRWLEEGGDAEAEADGDDGANNNNNQQCDLADGYYSFELGYVLPDYQDNLSWFATGWRGTGFVKMYSDDSGEDESLIGSCQFSFDTMVTQSADGGMTVPTAAMTLAIIGGIFALGALLCCYMKCCRGRGGKQVAAPSDVTVGGGYKRSEDDGTFISSKASEASPPPPSNA